MKPRDLGFRHWRGSKRLKKKKLKAGVRLFQEMVLAEKERVLKARIDSEFARIDPDGPDLEQFKESIKEICRDFYRQHGEPGITVLSECSWRHLPDIEFSVVRV